MPAQKLSENSIKTLKKKDYKKAHLILEVKLVNPPSKLHIAGAVCFVGLHVALSASVGYCAQVLIHPSFLYVLLKRRWTFL